MVVASEDRHHAEALHSQWQVSPKHLAELVGLAVEAQGLAFDLLIMLQLHLEEADHFHGDSRRATDGHTRVPVGRKHLLDGAVADEVSRGGTSVTGHDDPVLVTDGDQGGGVWGQLSLRAVDRQTIGSALIRPGKGFPT